MLMQEESLSYVQYSNYLLKCPMYSKQTNKMWSL